MEHLEHQAGCYGRGFSSCPLVSQPASLSLSVQIAQIDNQYPNMRPEQLAEELPETAPRFLVISFKYPKPDGRVQYPLCLVYYCPETCADRNRMMYTRFVNVISKALDITTGSL